jgi:hypothetical protein
MRVYSVCVRGHPSKVILSIDLKAARCEGFAVIVKPSLPLPVKADPSSEEGAGKCIFTTDVSAKSLVSDGTDTKVNIAG